MLASRAMRDGLDDFSDLIEDLREQAALAADEMNEGNKPLAEVISVPAYGPDDTVEGAAADVIERMVHALFKILSGAADPVSVAREALTPHSSRIGSGQQRQL